MNKLLKPCLVMIGIASVATVFAAEVDITKAVRDAGKGTTVLEYGTLLSGYTVDNAWAKVVCLGDVKTGVDTLTVEKIPNPDHHTRVKFFVCDDLARSVSHTKTYKTGVGGLSILVR